MPAIHTAFFADDFLFLDQVRDKTLGQALATPDPLSNFYRPISRQLYFWCVAGVSNESELAFHVTGLIAYVGLLSLLFLVARRLAGNYAATFATALMAVHYTADVPIRWACGSQELLSVSGALATILLHLSGRRGLATVTMALAALSKEVVLLTPAIAAIADRRPGESLITAAKRAWPLMIGVGIYGAVWLFAPHTRQAAGTEAELHPWGPVATYVHLIQVMLGAEARKGEMFRLPTVGPPLVSLALGLLALFGAGAAARYAGLVSRRKPAGVSAKPEAGGVRVQASARRHAMVTGVAWALLAVVPVIAVAILWSAYYYLYAMCGVAIALGAALSALPRGWAMAAFALLAWGSNSARHVDEFATPRSPWTEASHINKFYIERATRYCGLYLEDLRALKPELPPRSTLFYAGLRGNIAFQVADGPFVRWAYRDTSLRSYYLNNFSLDKARRGPLFFFIGAGDSLVELEGGPDLYAQIAYGMLVSEWPPGARDALRLDLERNPSDIRANYWIAWCHLAAGDRDSAIAALGRAGYVADVGPAPERAHALELSTAGDLSGALTVMTHAVFRHALDPAAHGLLADLYLVRDPDDPAGAIEALAARLLAPEDPVAWRRWAMVQTQRQRYLEALASFERYFKLAGNARRSRGRAMGGADSGGVARRRSRARGATAVGGVDVRRGVAAPGLRGPARLGGSRVLGRGHVRHAVGRVRDQDRQDAEQRVKRSGESVGDGHHGAQREQGAARHHVELRAEVGVPHLDERNSVGGADRERDRDVVDHEVGDRGADRAEQHHRVGLGAQACAARDQPHGE